jgi:hypothetical protein
MAGDMLRFGPKQIERKVGKAIETGA